MESADKSLSVSADSLIASLVNGSTNTESTGTSLLHSSPMQVSIQTYVNGTPTNQVRTPVCVELNISELLWILNLFFYVDRSISYGQECLAYDNAKMKNITL